MAKRISKSDIQGYFFLALIVMPIALLVKLSELISWLGVIAIFLTIIILIVWYMIAKKINRRAYLMNKYKDKKLVEDLMNKTFWQEQTADQLRDSLGSPHAIDRKILKTKKKEIWKYNHLGGNRYGIRITLDDDQVVGWEKKT
ncbi:hypothetical protein [Sneathiella sp. HT1-7]|uniref:hypothetical protein n=1 Tax=Sneathiella sp. HT1-7 TaxID=2887192 RepID=UPI001D142BCB|nr:hypothetical protein [Sneathiella sp. HT1-7]MCC3306038.1 hypothetical protein [Sneathiella sp. HT1-7]